MSVQSPLAPTVAAILDEKDVRKINFTLSNIRISGSGLKLVGSAIRKGRISQLPNGVA